MGTAGPRELRRRHFWTIQQKILIVGVFAAFAVIGLALGTIGFIPYVAAILGAFILVLSAAIPVIQSLQKTSVFQNAVRDLDPEILNLGGGDYATFPYVVEPIQDSFDTALKVLREVGASEKSAKRGLLILGKINSGKTRLAFEALHRSPSLQKWKLLLCQPRGLLDPELAAKLERGNKVVLFIDDLQNYVRIASELQTLEVAIHSAANRELVVATCRSEDEVQVGPVFRTLLEGLVTVRLPSFSENEKDPQAEKIIAEFKKQRPDLIHEGEWDGEVGSLVLGLKRKEDQYATALEEVDKLVLQAMKLLEIGGITRHTRQCIQSICSGVFGEKTFQEDPGEWRKTVERLVQMKFIRTDAAKDHLTAGQKPGRTVPKTGAEDGKEQVLVIHKDIYFEMVITDYPSPNQPQQLEQDLEALQRTPEDLREVRGLVSFGDSLFEQRKPQRALEAYKSALSIEEFDAGAWIGKGKALMALGQYKEAKDALENVIREVFKYNGSLDLSLVWLKEAEVLDKLAEVANESELKKLLQEQRHQRRPPEVTLEHLRQQLRQEAHRAREQARSLNPGLVVLGQEREKGSSQEG